METERLLSQAFLEAHPEDAALVLERLSPEEAAALLEETPPSMAAAVLKRMGPLSGAECLICTAAEQAGPIVAALPLDIAAGLLRRVESPIRDHLLAHVPKEVCAPLQRLLQYPEGTAGALMDPQVLATPADITVSELMARVRHSPQHILYYLYVVDRAQVLVGVLSLRELMLAPPEAPLASVMHPQVVRLSAYADHPAIVAHPGWREFHALPVVNEASVFIGIIRYETLRRLEDESVKDGWTQSALATFLALGELYWVGVSKVLAGLVSAVVPRPAQEEPVQEDNHGA